MDIKTFLQKRKLESIAINQIEQFHARNCIQQCNGEAVGRIRGVPTPSPFELDPSKSCETCLKLNRHRMIANEFNLVKQILSSDWLSWRLRWAQSYAVGISRLVS